MHSKHRPIYKYPRPCRVPEPKRYELVARLKEWILFHRLQSHRLKQITIYLLQGESNKAPLNIFFS